MCLQTGNLSVTGLIPFLMDVLVAFISQTGLFRRAKASFLIFDLGVDWRYGAAHFEELLLDYDPCSNWGNWVPTACYQPVTS